MKSNLPTESAVWAGVSATDGGSLTTTTNALKEVIGTSSRKTWTYFTADSSAPNGSQPHNSVPHLGVGDVLTASLTFTMPTPVASNAGSAGSARAPSGISTVNGWMMKTAGTSRHHQRAVRRNR